MRDVEENTKGYIKQIIRIYSDRRNTDRSKATENILENRRTERDKTRKEMIMEPRPMKGNNQIRQDSKRHQMEKNVLNTHETMTAVYKYERDRAYKT